MAVPGGILSMSGTRSVESACESHYDLNLLIACCVYASSIFSRACAFCASFACPSRVGRSVQRRYHQQLDQLQSPNRLASRASPWLHGCCSYSCFCLCYRSCFDCFSSRSCYANDCESESLSASYGLRSVACCLRRGQRAVRHGLAFARR